MVGSCSAESLVKIQYSVVIIIFGHCLLPSAYCLLSTAYFLLSTLLIVPRHDGAPHVHRFLSECSVE